MREEVKESRYVVFDDGKGTLYIDTGESSLFHPILGKQESIKRIVDPHNWKVGEIVFDQDFAFALTGSSTFIKRVF